jgi:hypothetical protein
MGEEVWKVQILLHTHACKCEDGTVESVPGMWGGEIMENGGGDEIKYDIFGIL